MNQRGLRPLYFFMSLRKSICPLKGVTNPTPSRSLTMTYFLVFLSVLFVANLAYGLVRFGFELGCRYQAASANPNIAHTARSIKPALTWAKGQTAYNRRRSVIDLMFGR
jgi:hypothetical protein